MKELQLYLQDNIWKVDHLGDGEPDLEVADLFSDDTSLPTPFTAGVRIQEVVAELAWLNPGKQITIDPKLRPRWNLHLWDPESRLRRLIGALTPALAGRFGTSA